MHYTNKLTILEINELSVGFLLNIEVRDLGPYAQKS